MREKVSAEDRVREIRRKTRKKYSAEEKVRIVLEGLRGEESIAALCRKEGIPSNLYYRWRALVNKVVFETRIIGRVQSEPGTRH